MKHMKAICFMRPSHDSIQALVEELRSPLYAEYHLFFTNCLKKSQIERLAEVDEFEVVKQVQEYYGDYLVLGSDLFSLGVHAPAYRLFSDSFNQWDGYALTRTVEGIIAVLLSLKKRPLIRYQKNSNMAKRLATEIQAQIQQENQLFDFRRPDTPPILLLLDRKNDPVTPMLSQWTYQAMVHELLGIHNGRVDLSHVPDVRPELKEIVLSAEHDPFYKKNMYLNLGDLGQNIKSYVDEFQHKTKNSQKIESIAEMKRFVEEYPEFRKLSGNVSKHVALVSELSRAVEKGSLLQVGELEQNLACFDNQANDLRALQELLEKPQVPKENKLRLVMLYALRYEKSPNNNLSALMQQLQRTANIDDRDIASIQSILQYAGADQRQEDVFLNETILSKSKQVFRGIKGAENVYEQHEPLLGSILDQLIKGRLKDHLYPFTEGQTKDRPQDVIVFCIGGVTYAEAKQVASLNAQGTGVRIVLGGTDVCNSRRWIEEVCDGASRSGRYR